MKRLILLLLVMVVVAVTVSSPLFASSTSITSRYEKVMMYIYQYLFPFYGKYYVSARVVIDKGGNGSGILGGDADDYANGKDDREGDNGRTKLGSGSIETGNGTKLIERTFIITGRN